LLVADATLAEGGDGSEEFIGLEIAHKFQESFGTGDGIAEVFEVAVFCLQVSNLRFAWRCSSGSATISAAWI